MSTDMSFKEQSFLNSHFFNLQFEEIYENIFVYHDLLPDNALLHDILIESEDIFSGELIYNKWTDWYTIGKICSTNPLSNFYDKKTFEDIYKKSHDVNKTVKELYLFRRLSESTLLAVDNYIKHKGINLPEKSFITQPNPAKYNENFHNNKFGYSMNFHTDYQIGEWWWPGDKFLLTATTYVNDNYDGGEIVFIVDNKMIEYKPRAGDIIVFPSGNPLYPGNKPYYHGVKVVEKGVKFLVRNYLKYNTDENLDIWLQKEEEYGKEQWLQLAMDQAKHATTLLYQSVVNEDGTLKNEIEYSDLVKQLYKI